MKKIVPIIFFTFLFFFNHMITVSATETFTIDDVSQHNSPNDCYVIFENSVYDLSDYISSHDRYLDIRDWCGEDMTEDFKDKAGIGRDHKFSSYQLLDEYYIGELATTSTEIDGTNSDSTSNSNPYNFALPFFGSIILYFTYYILTSIDNLKKFSLFSRQTFNLIWNTVLAISTIPSVIFGFILIFSYTFPSLREINFNFLYWHVEGSIVFGTVAIMHLITRLKLYLAPLKALRITNP